MSPEEEIALWKQWSENKNHPFYYLAQQRIARLGGQAQLFRVPGQGGPSADKGSYV